MKILNLILIALLLTSCGKFSKDENLFDSEKLIGVATKSLYVRKGFKNGTLFLSQRGNGANGAGDICKINEDAEFEVNSKLFDRLTIYSEKANAIIK